MTNQTRVFCVYDIASNVANVCDNVNLFVKHGIETGFMNFHILPVVVSPAAGSDHFWFTVQVNYYDPSVQEA